MIYTWEAEDCWAGRLFWKPHKVTKDGIGYTMTVCFKIGWMVDRAGKKIYQISFLTDGCVYGEETPEEMAKSLNDAGYAPLDTITLINILSLYEETRIKRGY